MGAKQIIAVDAARLIGLERFASATTPTMGIEAPLDRTFCYSLTRNEFREMPSEDGREFQAKVIRDLTRLFQRRTYTPDIFPGFVTRSGSLPPSNAAP